MKLAVTAILLSLLLASAAGAATKRIEDGKRETTALAENGQVDIIRASSSRFGRDLRFTITMRKRVHANRQNEEPQLLLNTRGDGKSDPEFVLFGDDLFDVRGDGSKRIAPAKLGAKGRTWSYRFDPKQIRNLDRYGWAAITNKGNAEDVAPNDRYVKAQY